MNNVIPYYYFQVADPDGNVIETTGIYIIREFVLCKTGTEVVKAD